MGRGRPDGGSGGQELEWLAIDPRALDWNGPVGRPFEPFGEEDLERPIIALFERAARRWPERVAVSDAEMSLTYGRLWDGVCGLAERIAAETQPGELVGIGLAACALFPLAMLACLAAGRPFVALDAAYPSDWIEQVLAEARPALVIGGEGDLGAAAARVLTLTSPPPAAQAGWRPTPLEPDAPACVLFTSGSTGRPKGIVNSQRGLLQRVGQSINACHIDAEDRMLTLASPCTIVGVRDAVTALVAGARLHLVDPQRIGARQVLEVIGAEAISILFAFPALLRSVVGSAISKEGGTGAGRAMRLVRVGGDTTLWSDIDLLRGWLAPGAAIQSIYAATEAPMMQWFVDDDCRGEDARVPIGYPLAGNRLAVIDEAGRPTPAGEVGELVAASPYVALGLWVDGDLRADANVAAEGRRFRTGDLVRQRHDGLIERLGRRDRQVKIRGVRVELDGVEAALRRHSGVADVGALARTSGGEGTATLVAYVSAADRAPEDLVDELKALMRNAPAAMRPGRIYLIDAVPRLPNSKLDVVALMALDAARAREEQAPAADPDADVPDPDGIALAVGRIWREVLRMPVGGPDDDFFEAGGDSLAAITLVLQLERALGLELPPTLVNEAPSFAGLCAAVRAQRSDGYTPLVPLKAGDAGAGSVFFVHGAGGNVTELFPIARAMAWPGAVIGVQARGLTGRDAPHATVEAMAEAYLEAVKARQPGGPYHLCGYSFGGLVAFEMARRLAEAGDEVGLVGLFDTSTSPVTWPLAVWPRFVRGRISCLARGAWGLLRGRGTRAAGLPGLTAAAPAGMLRVATSAVIAAARYRPGVYAGTLTLFAPAGRDPALPSPEAIWRRHARAVEVVPLPGAHLTMLGPAHADAAAAALTGCLMSVPSPLRQREGQGGE